MPLINTVKELCPSLREGPFTSLGSYPLFWLCSDGGTLHHHCVKENMGQCARSTRDHERNGWAIEGYDVNWEDGDMWCDHCGERIESAYAEPESNEA